jgi:hypothetical protein
MNKRYGENPTARVPLAVVQGKVTISRQGAIEAAPWRSLGFSGSIPSLSFTAIRSFCLQPRYRKRGPFRTGTMPLRVILAGSITSVEPTRAIASADATAGAFLKIGQTVTFEVQIAPRPAGGLPVIPGRVRDVQGNGTRAVGFSP